MSLQNPNHSVKEPVPVDIPDKRKYATKEEAEVDRTLTDAIEAAEANDDAYLVELLANELGSHYYDAQ